jgi:large subunit ribosomal protein L10
MTRAQKSKIIEQLVELFQKYPHFYLVDISDLNAADTTLLRRKCYDAQIRLIVVKNTLLWKALEKLDQDFSELEPVLHHHTAIMFTEVANAPARLIKEFRRSHDKPLIKAAYVQESIYIGDDKLDLLASIKSKEEMIADLILLLQSPMHTVLNQLQSGKDILARLVKALSEREG